MLIIPENQSIYVNGDMTTQYCKVLYKVLYCDATQMHNTRRWSRRSVSANLRGPEFRQAWSIIELTQGSALKETPPAVLLIV